LVNRSLSSEIAVLQVLNIKADQVRDALVSKV